MRDEPEAGNNGTAQQHDNNVAMTTIEESLNELRVPVEPYLENRIQEFGPNGEEHFVQSISLGEKLLDRAGKIDYKFVIDREKKEDDAPKQHPWTDVLKNLNNSYTEVCVLSDLMALLQQRQYLMLDPVQQPKPPYNTSQVVVARKLGLRSAGRILQLGVDNMQKGDVGRFHKALANLNSRFKMKKQGTYILGDATYKSCGSRKYFNDDGLFEVVRNPNPTGYPIKIELDPSVQMVSYLTISSTQDATRAAKFPVPSYWRRIPFVHAQILGVLYTLFVKEMFYLLSLDCMTVTQYRQAFCKVVGNEITAKLPEGGKLYITRHIEPALTKEKIEEASPSLNVEELCLQLHIHKLHKLSYEDDTLHEGSTYHTMMLGIVNNKPRQPTPLNFEILHAQHKMKNAQILAKLDELARSIHEPNITIRSGPCSTTQESSINVILTPISRIIPGCKVSLRVTIGLIGSKNTYQIDSSHRGPVYNGPDSDIAIDAVTREVRSHMVLMLRSACTHNSWSILSTEIQDEHIFTQCPNKAHHLTATVNSDLTVSCLFEEESFLLDRLQGQNVVHKLTLLLNVICEPVKVTRT